MTNYRKDQFMNLIGRTEFAFEITEKGFIIIDFISDGFEVITDIEIQII